VIPLLFETGAEASFDVVICIACSAAAQRQRLEARGWTPKVISQRIAAQLPIEKKMMLADFIIWTEAEMDLHRLQWRRTLAGIGATV